MAAQQRKSDRWLPAWRRAIATSLVHGGTNDDLVVLPSASEKDVYRVERTLKRELPTQLRALVLEHSRGVEMRWQLRTVTPPARFKDITGGCVHWNLDELPDIHHSCEIWEVPAWAQMLAFTAVGNGDSLALDLEAPGQPVVYLEHEEQEARTLAPNLFAFLDRWSALGCPGPEIWSLAPFLGLNGLEPDGENGQRWREWFGIDRASGDRIVVHTQAQNPLPEIQAARLLQGTPLTADRETEAWNLAQLCLASNRSDLTLQLVEALQTPSLKVEASMVRIAALIQTGQLEAARSETHRAVSEWLAPPTSQHSINQVVSKQRLLAVLSGLAGVDDLRAQVAAAPEPDMFVPEGDFF